MKILASSDRVALCDTDASGIVHSMFIMRFFEVGEREVLRAMGILWSTFRAFRGQNNCNQLRNSSGPEFSHHSLKRNNLLSHRAMHPQRSQVGLSPWRI